MYSDQVAAEEAWGGKHKKDLPSNKSPFLHYFDYGTNNDGYWTYAHMVCQLEDCVDVVKVMCSEFDHVFLFDHSSGHAKSRDDALSTSKMNVGWGGNYKMRTTKIEKEEGFLGAFEHESKLTVGMLNPMMFLETEAGPFMIKDPAERLARKYDRETEKTKTLNKTRAELETDLRANNENWRCPKGTTKKDLEKECERLGIACTKSVPVILPGWVGKPKGLLQVCWERGLIDENKSYTRLGIKDPFGNHLPGTNLDELLGSCDDFQNEISALGHHAAQLGVRVILTPKCHAELAGEGIEYTWGCAKGNYRNLTLSKKKGKENFRTSVKNCMSEEVLSLERIRKFARRARQYIVAYHAIDQHGDCEVEEKARKCGPVALEGLIKKFKTHRCALDFDHKFIRSVMEGDS